MIKTAVILNGQQVNPPINIRGLQIELNYDSDTKQTITLSNFEFINEEATKINNWKNTGTSGGVGVGEGMPLQLRVSDGLVTETIFDGYLDLLNAEFDCDRVVADGFPKKQIDWLNEVADSKTFEYIYRQEGLITINDFVFIPYIISTVPNYRDALLAQISVAIITLEIRRAISDISTKLAEGATVIDSVGGIIGAIGTVIFFATALLTLVNLILDTIDLLIQPVKYKPAMYAKTLMERGCLSFGLKFKSSILLSAPYSNMVVIPESYNNPADSEKEKIKGFRNPDPTKQNGFYNGTFGDFIREMKILFNAKVLIDGDTLYLERRNFKLGQPKFQLPELDQKSFTLNGSELNTQINISFSYDGNDRNTVDEWQGTNVQVNLTPKVTLNKDYYLLKGFLNIQSKFALAKRKTELTLIEKIVDPFLDVVGTLLGSLIGLVNRIIEVVNKITNTIEKIEKIFNFFGIDLPIDIPDIPTITDPDLENLIEDRIGMMKLENDMILVPKVAIIQRGAIDRKTNIMAVNETYLSARYIYENFYKQSDFSNSKDHGQYVIYSVKNVPFNFTDYQNVKNNPFVLTYDGQTAELISLKWRLDNRTADIDFKVNKLYLNNLEAKIFEPVGR